MISMPGTYVDVGMKESLPDELGHADVGKIMAVLMVGLKADGEVVDVPSKYKRTVKKAIDIGVMYKENGKLFVSSDYVLPQKKRRDIISFAG